MSRESPLAPRHLPVVGHMANILGGAPWDDMEGWLRDHGPTQRLAIAGAMVLISADPAVIRRVLLDNADNYRKDRRTMEPFLGLLGDGLLTSDGALWKQQRAALAPAFRGDALRNLVDVTRRAVERSGDSLDAHAHSGDVVDVGTVLGSTSGRFQLGLRDGDRYLDPAGLIRRGRRHAVLVR